LVALRLLRGVYDSVLDKAIRATVLFEFCKNNKLNKNMNIHEYVKFNGKSNNIYYIANKKIFFIYSQILSFMLRNNYINDY